MKFKLLIFSFICSSILASSKLKSVAQHQESRLPAIFVTIDDRFSHPKKTTFCMRESFDKPYDGAIEYESTLTKQGRKLKSKIIKTTYYASPEGNDFHKMRTRIKRIPRERTNRMFAAFIEVAARHHHIDEWYPMPDNLSLPCATSWAVDDPQKGLLLLSHSNNDMRTAQENCIAYRLLSESNPSKRIKDKYDMYRRNEKYAVRKKLDIDFELTDNWHSIQKNQRIAALKLQKIYR